MNLFKRMYKSTNGKKTLVGAILHFLVVVIGTAQASFNFQVLDGKQLGQIDQLATVIMGLGLADKARKRI